MKKLLTAAAALVVAAVTACSSGNPMVSPTGSAPASGDSIIVGSANFPESELLANIYAGALKAKGITVSTKLNIASRETYVPALKSGELVQVLPQYEGSRNVVLSAVYPSRQFLPAKVRLFIDYLADLYGPLPYWER